MILLCSFWFLHIVMNTTLIQNPIKWSKCRSFVLLNDANINMIALILMILCAHLHHVSWFFQFDEQVISICCHLSDLNFSFFAMHCKSNNFNASNSYIIGKSWIELNWKHWIERIEFELKWIELKTLNGKNWIWIELNWSQLKLWIEVNWIENTE